MFIYSTKKLSSFPTNVDLTTATKDDSGVTSLLNVQEILAIVEKRVLLLVFIENFGYTICDIVNIRECN